MRSVLALYICLAIIGCVDPSRINPPTPTPSKATLENIAFESFQKRDVVRASKLRALKGTKFDANRIENIEKAGAEASRETWEPVAKALASVLDKIPQDDQATFDSVLESLAKAAERAGK